MKSAVNRAGIRRGLRTCLGHVAFIRRRAKGNDRTVAIVSRIRRSCTARTRSARGQITDWSIVRRWLRKFAGERLRTFHFELTPDELLHCLFRLYPGSAGFTPARGAENCHFESEPISFGRCMANGIKPLGCAELDFLVDGLAAAGVDVGQLKTGNAGALHPLEIFGDPFFGDVAPGPVPPGSWFSRFEWLFETLFERIGSGALSSGAGAHSEECR